jgi:hypothetical protein
LTDFHLIFWALQHVSEIKHKLVHATSVKWCAQSHGTEKTQKSHKQNNFTKIAIQTKKNNQQKEQEIK